METWFVVWAAILGPIIVLGISMDLYRMAAWLRERRKRPESQEEVLRAWHRRHPNIPPLEGCRYCQEASPPSSPATETTAETPPGNGAG